MTPRAETTAEQLFFTTVYIQTNGQGVQSTGTGFIVAYTVEGGLFYVLVTNKHVLEGAEKATFRMVSMGDDGQPSDAATQITVNEMAEGVSWKGHDDPAVDVAVMPLGRVLEAMETNSAAPFFKSISPELFLTREQANDLDAIEQVLFIGYPNGLFDTASWLPIARRGQTATPIQNDYRGMPSFLIDASVFPGSSGSPVFIFDRGSYVSRDGTTNIAHRLFFVGVVAAVHQRRVTGEIMLASKRPVAVLDDLIDLGIVFKASAIQECIDGLVNLMGLKVLEAQPATDLA
ncbi:serine protease [Micrococcus terreus]|uniref:S1 family peptidase n=1 Tax=Micrococcus terreus TaxID=574650 RepID=UPI0021A2B99C|nr:serine protease [Micrococcus terreus]MCT2088556.1 serine protease [Micrococcus terreus]